MLCVLPGKCMSCTTSKRTRKTSSCCANCVSVSACSPPKTINQRTFTMDCSGTGVFGYNHYICMYTHTQSIYSTHTHNTAHIHVHHPHTCIFSIAYSTHIHTQHTHMQHINTAHTHATHKHSTHTCILSIAYSTHITHKHIHTHACMHAPHTHSSAYSTHTTHKQHTHTTHSIYPTKHPIRLQFPYLYWI